MDKESLPKAVIMWPEYTFSPLYWDEEGVAIGDYYSFILEMKSIRHRLLWV